MNTSGSGSLTSSISSVAAAATLAKADTSFGFEIGFLNFDLAGTRLLPTGDLAGTVTLLGAVTVVLGTLNVLTRGDTFAF